MTINDPRDDPAYRVGEDKTRPKYDRSEAGPVAAKQVTEFHTKDDLDSSQEAHHHSLGPKHDQAAAGDHSHKTGTGYNPALKGVTITGSRGGGAALVSVISALVKLGATDTTTP
jgi:hypothetical protein